MQPIALMSFFHWHPKENSTIAFKDMLQSSLKPDAADKDFVLWDLIYMTIDDEVTVKVLFT